MIESGTATQAELEKVAAQLKVATNEYNNNRKMIETTIQANNAAKGSYEELYRSWHIAQTELKLMEGTLTKNAQRMVS